MTIQEAIERLEVHKGWGYREGTMTALDMAISALKELQHYREIGTVEECREAVEKQKAKKIYHERWNGIDGVPYDLCPVCKKNLCTTGIFARGKMNYCENCGQAIQWENLEGMEDE